MGVGIAGFVHEFSSMSPASTSAPQCWDSKSPCPSWSPPQPCKGWHTQRVSKLTFPKSIYIVLFYHPDCRWCHVLKNEVECAGELATARAVSSAGTIMVCFCECSATGFEPLFPPPMSTSKEATLLFHWPFCKLMVVEGLSTGVLSSSAIPNVV